MRAVSQSQSPRSSDADWLRRASRSWSLSLGVPPATAISRGPTARKRQLGFDAAPVLRRADALVGRHQSRGLRIDDKIGRFITIVGIPSAFLLHGYVGFIFGSVKANPWWSTPLMPVVFLFFGHRLRRGCGDAALHGALLGSTGADRDAVSRYDREVSVLCVRHRLLAREEAQLAKNKA